VVNKLGLTTPKPELAEWKELVSRLKNPSNGVVRIAVVGKYVALIDSYKSVQEALIHGGIAADAKVKIDWLSSEDFENGEGVRRSWLATTASSSPAAFGVRGVEGHALRHPLGARERAAVLRHLPGDADGGDRVLALGVRHQRRALHGVGPRHLRPGDLPDELAARGHGHGRHAAAGGDDGAPQAGSRAAEVYGSQEISERHRHRYEVNNAYRDQLAEQGMQVSGVSPDGNLVEMVELPDHPLVRGHAGAPGAQVAPRPPAPALRRLRGRRAAPPRGGGHAHVPRGPRDRGGRAVSDAATRGGTVEAPAVADLFRLDAPFFLIAGPCVLEDERLNVGVGEALARLADDLGLPVVFKASFDKANRSSPGSPRGPGLDEGLERLAQVRRATGLPLLTDVTRRRSAPRWRRWRTRSRFPPSSAGRRTCCWPRGPRGGR
jgi:hypothetical protein